jgi:bile acid:Na+ symporter, BASS family
MNTAPWMAFSIQTSMAMLVFCVALNANRQDAAMLRQPRFLLRAVFAMKFVIGAALLFEFKRIVEIALIALALSPVPPILPNRQLKAGGAYSSIVGVFVATALFSILFVPLVLEILGRIFERSIGVPPASVAAIILSSVLAPLAVGVVLRSIAPAFAQRIVRPLSIFAGALLVLTLIPVLIVELQSIVALIGDFTLVVIVAFVLAGLAVGHLLGGPNPDDRTVLALATATRHPAIAMLIISDSQDKQTALAAILLVLIVGALVSIPYVRWRRRIHEQTVSPHAMKAKARAVR